MNIVNINMKGMKSFKSEVLLMETFMWRDGFAIECTVHMQLSYGYLSSEHITKHPS